MKPIEAFHKVYKILKENKIEEYESESKYILSYIVKCSLNEVFLSDRLLSNNDVDALEVIVNKRIKGEPLQHILKQTDFMGLTFKVDNNTLIPRFDTERIVEAALEILKDIPKPKVMDICCGSGAIGLSVAYYNKSTSIVLSDISSSALNIAKENAENLNLKQSALFLLGNLFSPLEENIQFDMIISNPPYIKSEDIKNLSKDVKKEPLIALDGGKDGLDFYRRIIKESPLYLKESGYLILETGYDQKQDLINLLQNSDFTIIKTINDYGNNHRGFVCKKT